jgi:CBS domain-containing protein
MALSIAYVLDRSGDEIISIGPDATVFEAIGRMVEHNVGSILVTEDGALRGIFTERDYLRRIALEGRSSKTTRVEEVMTPEVLCVSPKETVEECLAIMTAKKCRHLPVLREGRLAGLVSIGDCVRDLSEQAQWHLESLQHYVTGQYPG